MPILKVLREGVKYYFRVTDFPFQEMVNLVCFCFLYISIRNGLRSLQHTVKWKFSCVIHFC